MPRTPIWRRYLRFWGTDVRADVEAELGFHLDQLTEQYIEEGLSPHEARRKAEGRFGDARRVRDECVTLDDDWEREKRWRTLLNDFRQDLVLSLRALDRNRGFACAAILTLALGIGASTAIFSIVDNLLLKPLPVEDPERLVLVTSGAPGATSSGKRSAIASYWSRASPSPRHASTSRTRVSESPSRAHG